MKRPHSFTGEDVLEINCHGNPLIMKTILSELLALGCRLARPGEFSQRAFFNNRIDLSQAEALASMIANPMSANPVYLIHSRARKRQLSPIFREQPGI